MSDVEKKVGLAIVGLDHWYLGLNAARLAQSRPDVHFAVVAHHDAARAEHVARDYGAERWTTDYHAAIAADDVDVVATACRISENAAICIDAAQHRKHIVASKPVAMSLAEVEQIAAAVLETGVSFVSGEMSVRLSPSSQKLATWISEGRIGSPISALIIHRAPLPTQQWPGEFGPTWWTNPRYAAAGGWLDHAIYHIDHLRSLFGDVDRVSGEIATLMHPDVQMEDFGVATYRFKSGAIATLEVTWTGTYAASFWTRHFVGTRGQVVEDPTLLQRTAVTGDFGPLDGWLLGPPAQSDLSTLQRPIDLLIDAVKKGTEPPGNIADVVQNMRAGLAFYEAARSGATVRL
jgi:predicted dehydrogenase